MSPELLLFMLITQRIDLDTGPGGLRESGGANSVCHVVMDGDASVDPTCSPLLAIGVDALAHDAFSKDGVMCVVRFIIQVSASVGGMGAGQIGGRLRQRFHRALFPTGNGWEWSAMAVSRSSNPVRRRGRSIALVEATIVGRRV